MPEEKQPIRVKYILTHPVQYYAPLLRRLSQCDEIELMVIYGTDAGAGKFYDVHFQQQVSWDVELLDGYESTVLNPGAELGRGYFWMPARGVFKRLDKTTTDVAIIHGWGNRLYLGATLFALAKNIPVLYRTDVQAGYDRRDFDPGLRGSSIRTRIKPFMLHHLLCRIDGFLAVGSANRDFYLAAGVNPSRIFWAPHSIDASLFESHGSGEERAEAEQKLGLAPGSFRVIFSGKLVARKRPFDIVEAVALMPSRDSVEIIFIGDGELKDDLQELARARGVRAHFTGFVNQTELPLLYSMGHVMVLPSKNEPWGIVVNEAMAMGIPAVISEGVGCRNDLVIEGQSGYIRPVGNVRGICVALQDMAISPDLHDRLRKGARRAAAAFSIENTVEGYLEAIAEAAGRNNN